MYPLPNRRLRNSQALIRRDLAMYAPLSGLLHHVCELVRQQAPAGRGRWVVAASAKDDVVAEREGRRVDSGRGGGSAGVIVDTNTREIDTEARLHHTPRLRLKRASWRRERFVDVRSGWGRRRAQRGPLHGRLLLFLFLWRIILLCRARRQRDRESRQARLRGDPGPDELVLLRLLCRLLALWLEHLLLCLQPRDVGDDRIAPGLLLLRPLLLVGEREADERGCVHWSLVLDLRREAGCDLVERDRRRLERKRLAGRGQRRDAAGSDDAGRDEAGGRGHGILDVLHQRVGKHLVLHCLALRRLQQRLASLQQRLLLLVVVALRPACLLALHGLGSRDHH